MIGEYWQAGVLPVSPEGKKLSGVEGIRQVKKNQCLLSAGIEEYLTERLHFNNGNGAKPL